MIGFAVSKQHGYAGELLCQAAAFFHLDHLNHSGDKRRVAGAVAYFRLATSALSESC